MADAYQRRPNARFALSLATADKQGVPNSLAQRNGNLYKGGIRGSFMLTRKSPPSKGAAPLAGKSLRVPRKPLRKRSMA